jgi:uncharacterized protein
MAPVDLEITTRSKSNEWPNEAWKAEALRSQEWRPIPFQEFIIKIHSRCNLACDYCYIYEMADQTWQDRPGAMSREVMEQTARRIGEHVAAHGIGGVRLCFHGGEPLLVGPDFFAYAADALRRHVPDDTALELSVQTNAVLLDENYLQVLAANDIHLCVSIDGDRDAHDRHRRYANGQGSYDKVVNALRLLGQEPYRKYFAGLICVIDLENDPVGTYESLLEFSPPSIDFLLRHGNWSAPPPGLSPTRTPYGDWLIAVFDRWYGATRQETSVRILQNIIKQVLAGRSGYDGIGLAPSTLIEIETGGTLEQVCTLKGSYHGATATGFDIFEHDLDLALQHPSIAARQVGTAALSETCQKCEIRDLCGGGNYVHRYRAGSGYRNPSVYCRDLFKLIQHVRQRVTADLEALKDAR